MRRRRPMHYQSTHQEDLTYRSIPSGIDSSLLLDRGQVELVIRHPSRTEKMIAYEIGAAGP